ncbi:Rrf2 family transcriptional regulator [Crocinitomicaceae bacterium CZZ-1]|uniref:Rrf2 family transcriptional regulator n=1 Tax=Taishania pollutisoli TaxID=2766479 RepID=A0A8J6PAP3_9FLAO|nr:Rrf2 family transcriptional regulator [Taishania pollutisoli]MBC9811232.1 Rrf2 family transcriptional regulator [Taishania pollutisoli]MBX2947853.1 Rrf2 family transcriptional regulator [Crocinitomicaceae bacterium]NGF75015.1 Rrf2 family transcriptional regulator [Fluviicola sp. SGL-29]
MFSKACEYGIKAIIYIATQSLNDNRVKIGDIAKNTDSPVAFTAKVLGALVKRNIVQSQTGPNGGFYIEKHRMDAIRVSDIVTAIDGDELFEGCALGLKSCSHLEPCPLHDKFVEIRSNLKKVLQETSVYDLTVGLQEGVTRLIRQA